MSRRRSQPKRRPASTPPRPAATRLWWILVLGNLAALALFVSVFSATTGMGALLTPERCAERGQLGGTVVPSQILSAEATGPNQVTVRWRTASGRLSEFTCKVGTHTWQDSDGDTHRRLDYVTPEEP